jgi:alpha-N-arabinofuranosidase
MGRIFAFSTCLLGLCLAAPFEARAQGNLTIYTDALASGWSDASYNCTRNFDNASPVHAGSASISATVTAAWGGIQLTHPNMTNTAYSSISFWLHGGTSGGQQLQMYGLLGGNVQSQRFYLNSPLADQWQQYTVPLSAIGVANATNFSGFAIQDSVGSTEPTFYLDDIQLVTIVPPAVTHLTIDANQPLRTVDARLFGINAAQWDGMFDTPLTLTQLNATGARALRFPGGSNSDDYHWLYNRQDHNNWTWQTSLANYIHVLTNLNGVSMITLNYGTGSTNEAAAWVAYVNAATTSTQPLGTDSSGTNWQTAGYWASLRAAAPLGSDDGRNFLRLSRSAPLGFKYWEIGNEIYGSWETDSNTVAHDPYTYALRARDYISLIKSVDPTVKIGVVVTPGEDSYANNMSHPVLNPRTGETHYGWTPVVLATLKSFGVLPDFLIHHRYPQNPGGEDDTGLLLSSSAWLSDAANLRQQITDYVGPGGTNIELLCTENNSVSSNPGKQSTSLVNGLFFADSLAALMQTEFNGLFWWNLRNGDDNFSGNTNASLYGWRSYGDYGVTEGTDYYPPYYTMKLMQDFAQAGDSILSAGSDYPYLAAYAARRQNGSLTILAVNKTAGNISTGQVAVAGFTPSPTATVYSYGIPQDNAAQSGIGSPDVDQTSFFGAGTNFNYAFPPYSATVLSLAPAPASFLSVSVPPASGQVVFQLQGQTGVPYVVQFSTNLLSWTPVSTNTLLTSPAYITNSLDPFSPVQFWRAVWAP